MKRIVPAFVVVVTVALVLFVGVTYGRGTRPAGVLHDLERAQPERVFAARLSIGMEHRPCVPLLLSPDSVVPREHCGTRGDAPPFTVRLARNEASLDPDTMQASALTAILWWDGKEASLDKAIYRLSDALRLGGDSVPLLVDLSAAHLARAQRAQNSPDLMAGLDFAQKALAIDPGNPEALFNAALASEALFLVEQAIQAWEAYLAVDKTSGWADEANARRQALVAGLAPRANPTTTSTVAEVDAFATKHPQEARELGSVDVLGRWASAMLVGSVSQADSLLAFAGRLGNGLGQRGDTSLADAVHAIRAAAGDKDATRTLALAHQAYARGQRASAEGSYDPARQSYEQVLALNPRSPALLGWASELHMVTQHYTGRPRAARATADSLILHGDSLQHPAFFARARWLKGLEFMGAAQYKQAGEYFGSAARTYDHLGYAESYGATRALEGFMLYEQGDPQAGLGLAHEALRELQPYRCSTRLHTVLRDLAEFVARDGMHAAAATIQDEDVSVAGRVKGRIAAPEALLARASFAAVMGDTASAATNLDSAAVLYLGLKDGRQISRIANVRAIMEARSAADLDAPMAFFDTASAPWARAALLRRVEFHLAARDTAGARIDLDSVTARIGRMAHGEDDFHLRAAIIEQARNRFDQLVMLHVRAGRPHDALRALERSRLSFSPGGGADTGRGRRLAAPARHVALEYALIGDTLLTWTVQGTSVTFREQRVSRDALVLAIERMGRAMETRGRDAHADPELRQLYDWLIRPVQGGLGPKETPLVIVADGVIAAVPFAALLDGQRNRRLMEDHPSRIAATLAGASRPQPPADHANLRALLIADPDLDLREHPTLGRLGGAGREVESLRRGYHRNEVLQGAGATVDSFRRHAPAAHVIHYAGHAVFDDARPERSFLVLADRGPAGRLSAATLSTWDLSGVRLVVLSACRTVRAGEGRSGGFAGLSGALLSAQAGGVVGSLWEVDDALTQPLMEAFHREYRRTGDPAAALRNAQLEMLRQGRSPAAWAGFRYVGR